MSQVYLKRCDRCGGISELANTPNPDGWVTMADQGAGILASFDLCANCQDEMGVRQMFRDRLRSQAVGQLKKLFQPKELPELARSLHYDEIVAKIEAGAFDEDFHRGDGINLPQEIADLDVAEAELVE